MKCFGALATLVTLRLTRCLRCNALLQSVPKSEVLDPLSAEPLTLHYYHDFRRCTGCGRIYWPGTHIDKLAARLARVTGECLRFEPEDRLE